MCQGAAVFKAALSRVHSILPPPTATPPPSPLPPLPPHTPFPPHSPPSLPHTYTYTHIHTHTHTYTHPTPQTTTPPSPPSPSSPPSLHTHHHHHQPWEGSNEKEEIAERRSPSYQRTARHSQYTSAERDSLFAVFKLVCFHFWNSWRSRCTSGLSSNPSRRTSQFSWKRRLEHEVWDSLESLSLGSDTANRNTWNNLLDLVTHCDFGNRMHANLEDEALGRLGLSCRYALNWLCAELDTFWHPGTLQPLVNDTPSPCMGSLLGVQPGRQWGDAQQRKATRPKGLRSFSLRTDGDMILLLLLHGSYVRYPCLTRTVVIDPNLSS